MEMIALDPMLSLKNIGIKNSQFFYQLSAKTLVEQTLIRQLGELNDTGALCINTGKFTGRSPQDKFIVKDAITANAINWNNYNIPISEHYFLQLRQKLTAYLSAQKEVWVRDCYASADPQFRLNIRVVNENPWSNLFAHNMFLRPTEHELEHFTPEWTILQAPGFVADPLEDGTRSPHFAIISFTHKIILIGGTGYTGEMKKGIFTVLNFLLPTQNNVLPMHCSANMGEDGDTAIFFGLSGTGKTTLSADPTRHLIGDDEHGWNNDGVFNFEGGCYAKTIDLSAEKEPDIFNAIKHGALVENVDFFEKSNVINFAGKSITENTRVSYPLDFITHALHRAVGGHPKNIFFLTCDANGVIPPISRLSPGQAMYQFMSGYTARVAGTEAGVTEPKSTFSTCFGAPFMPLHPAKYAQMLGKKMQEHKANVWLVNTGWVGGRVGIGSRVKLAYTRAMIAAALNGELANANFTPHPVFGFNMPAACSGVPTEILDPRQSWADATAYDERANQLAKQFIKNFEQYAGGANADILAAAPVVS